MHVRVWQDIASHVHELFEIVTILLNGEFL